MSRSHLTCQCETLLHSHNVSELNTVTAEEIPCAPR